MANTLMHAAMVDAHALRRGKRACSCCTPMKATGKGAQALRQRMRQVEDRFWRKDQDQ